VRAAWVQLWGILSGMLCLELCADEVVLKSGQKFSGSIIRTDGKTVTLQMSVGTGQAEVPYPLVQIEQIRFSNSPEIQAWVEAGKSEDWSKFQLLWEKRLPYLKLRESDTGDLGLRLAAILLQRETKKAAAEAEAIARQIEQEDWSERRRKEATRLRLLALAAAGKVEQAMAEAETMQDVSGADEFALASARVQMRLVQADLSLRKLKELEEEWPKWDQMVDKRRERTELLNAALDGFLFPAVFYPEQIRASAEGLWKAAELYGGIGRKEEALRLVDEILQWFPQGEFKVKAEELKKQLMKKEKMKEKK
jgi:hypothetical protein